jgi:uncharacterized protein YndB with AHSA1/START domain
MADILHRIGIQGGSPKQVYDAITTLDGLAGWWTDDTVGETSVGGVIEFRFEPGGIDMRVAQLEPERSVRWDVVGGPAEWIGTSVQWDLRQDGEWTIVLFRHEGWREPVEFMHHCSTKWATFLMSLKQLLESGSGSPAPKDVKISDWH